MNFRFLTAAMLTAGCCGFLSGAVPMEQRFEAEKVLLNQDAIVKNHLAPGAWNLWSRDRDSDRKWSGGVVLQSNILTEPAPPGKLNPS